MWSYLPLWWLLNSSTGLLQTITCHLASFWLRWGLNQHHQMESLIMFSVIWNACKNLINRVKETIKNITKPATVSLVADTVTDITRTRRELVIENALLRQQLIILKRQIKRPQLTNGDRLRLLFLSRLTQFWDKALHLVQPQTLLRWHRDLFHRYWKHISKPKQRKPRIPQATIDLIKEIAQNNRL